MKKEIFIDQRAFSKKKYRFFLIVADIGGVNASIAVVGVVKNTQFEIIVKETFLTSEITKIHLLLNDLLREVHECFGIDIGRCCISAAGPVSRYRNYIRLTSTGLEINRKEVLSNTMLSHVILINNFEAVGYGIDILDKDKDMIRVRHVGDDLSSGSNNTNTYAVMGLGTGLGISIVCYNFSKYMHTPLPSEGGHIDFTPTDELEFELARFLKRDVLKRDDQYPELENVLSEQGIESIFSFLCQKRLFPETDITRRISSLARYEKIQAISANYGVDETCTKTMDMLVKVCARAARMLCLMSECYSGLFLTGRIVQNNIDLFNSKEFMVEFEKQDMRSGIFKKTPVYILMNKDVGIYGCCNVATNFFNLS